MRVRVLAAVLVLLTASCGSDPEETSAGLEPVGSEIDAEGLRVGCPNGPFFPLASLDTLPPLIEDSSVPDVADAIAPFLGSEEGNFWPQDGWRVLEVVDGERVQLVHPGSPETQAVAFMSADWTGEAWRWSGSSIPNDCVLVVEPSTDDGVVVDWQVDPGAEPLGPDATKVVLQATERGCASGQPMGDRLNEPEVTSTDDAVLILLTAQPPEGDAQDCPGNPSQRVEIDLPEPLGQRELRDARATDLGELRLLLEQLIDNESEQQEAQHGTTAPDSGGCDPALVVETVDGALASARLQPGVAAWTTPSSSVFAAQTTAPEDFAVVLGFDCSWAGMQVVGDHERYAVAAWTGDRMGAVIQATDQPNSPYSEDKTVDLLATAPRGEVVDTDTWAAEGPDGQTIILLNRGVDVLGLVAKSWIADQGLASSTDDMTTDEGAGSPTDQVAIPALTAAGGRNVGGAEPSHGSSVALYYLVTPLGDTIFVTVGPKDDFDPIAQLPAGATSDRDLGEGDPVRFVDPSEPYPTTAAGFTCNGYGWMVEAENGDIEETSEFISDLMTVLGCA
jgi:hypothetical protein